MSLLVIQLKREPTLGLFIPDRKWMATPPSSGCRGWVQHRTLQRANPEPGTAFHKVDGGCQHAASGCAALLWL